MRFVLPQDQIAEIKDLHRRCSIKRYADRFKALLMLHKGLSCTEVGELLLLDDDTIRTYKNQYLTQGADSLMKDNNKGSQAYLSIEQLETLDKHLQNNVYSDSKGVRDWVIQEFNIRYTTSGILSLLKRIGFVYKKPVLTPCKANLEKQEEFISEYRELKNNLPEGDQIYFTDGVHPQHNTT